MSPCRPPMSQRAPMSTFCRVAGEWHAAVSLVACGHDSGRRPGVPIATEALAVLGRGSESSSAAVAREETRATMPPECVLSQDPCSF